MERKHRRSPVEKVAILLQFLGEEAAAKVMRNIPMNEVHRMGRVLLTMKQPSVEEVDAIIAEFIQILNQSGGLLRSGEEFTQNVIRLAYGHDTASRLWEALMASDEQNTFSSLNDMDPKDIYEFTKAEHPQTICMILAHLEPAVAGKVLSQLPEVTRKEVIMRLARLKRVSTPILKEVSEILQTEVLNLSVAGEEIGGLKKAAVILNHTDRTVEAEILKKIRQEDVELAEGIQNLMFVFDDVANLDDRAIQEVLREIDTRLLAKALRGADEEVKEKIYHNMSQRATVVLQEEMEAIGPTRLSEVEEAQMEIIKAILQLRDEGRIVIYSGAEDDVFV